MNMNRRALARQAAGAKVAAPAKEESDASGVKNVSRKLEMQLEKGDLYGALQMYKTLFMRRIKGEPDAAAQEKAIELALDAALNLIKHGQNTAAAEMANQLVGVYTDHHWRWTGRTKVAFASINDAFTAKLQFSADLALFLKNAVKWTQTEGSRKRGDAELQLLLSRAHRKSGDFQHAAKHFLHAEAPAEWAALVFDWSKKGYARETDLYVARAVLQLLSLESLRDANAPTPAPRPASGDSTRPTFSNQECAVLTREDTPLVTITTLVAVAAVATCSLVIYRRRRAQRKLQRSSFTASDSLDVAKSPSSPSPSLQDCALAKWPRQVAVLVVPLLLVSALVVLANLDTLFGRDADSPYRSARAALGLGSRCALGHDAVFLLERQSVVGLFLLLSFIKLVSSTTAATVLDKELKMREMLKITNSALLASWVATATILSLPVVLVLAALLKFGNVFSTTPYATQY